jgi:aryl-alcohol dehydrogenase-like predicted oxidoreductase
MRYLTVGTAKPISKIGLGTWQFGSREWGYGERYADHDAIVIVRRALDLGVTLFDTAELYGLGRSERILGQGLGDARGSVVVATKLFPVLPWGRVVRSRAQASANRLGLSRLDLYQVHWPNPFFGDDMMMGAMRRLQVAGLVDEVGVSSYSLERWRSAEEALGGRILTNQVGYHLLDRRPERHLLPFATSTDHAVIAFSPLAQGLLSGRYDRGHPPANFRAADPLFSPEHMDNLNDLLATLGEIGDAHGASPAQVALAWAIHHPAVAAIPGASSVEQLERNVAAADMQLAGDEYQALQTASARFLPGLAADPSPPRSLAAARHLARAGKQWMKTRQNDRHFPKT